VEKFPCLVKRGGSYYMCMRAPKDLVPVLRKRELKRSLNTKDHREARRQYRRVYGELLRQITGAQGAAQPANGGEPSIAEEAMQEAIRFGSSGLGSSAYQEIPPTARWHVKRGLGGS